MSDTWSATDEQFFRAANDLFSAEFLYGAGVLLASYDDEPRTPAQRTQQTVPTAATHGVPTPGGVTRTPLGG